MPVSGQDTAISGAPKTTKPQPAAPDKTGQTLPLVVPSPAPFATQVAPKPARRWWLWALGGALAVGFGGVLYLQPWAAKVPAVAVETVTLGPVTRVLAVNGRIATQWSVDIRPLVSGVLLDVLVAEGDVVKPAQVLMQLDTATQQAVVRQAVAGLDTALAAQQAAIATHARTQALGTNAARVALENAARAELQADQEVARMTALLEQSQIQLDRFTLRAPKAGTVLTMQADLGQNVDPATVLMTIGDLNHLVVETSVDEAYATQIRKDQPATLQLSGETLVRAGHVSFVSQRVDADTGGLAVKLAPDATLSAPIGLTVTANITVDDRASAITVPRAALIRSATGDGVLVVADGRAKTRAVTVIEWPAERLIVTDGLNAGDVVIADATGLTDGQAVKVAP